MVQNPIFPPQSSIILQALLEGLGPSIIAESIAESANSKLRPHVHHGFRPRVHWFNVPLPFILQ